MRKLLVFFVEGCTEIEFYKKIVEYLKQRQPKRQFAGRPKIKFENMNGIGGFKKEAYSKFIRKIRRKYGDDYHYTVVLCVDTDVFESAHKPPVTWEEVEKPFKRIGVKVIAIKARRSIEDWILYDEDGIKSFLDLPQNTKLSGNTGYEKLQNLFKQKDRMYYKGKRSSELISHLNIERILEDIRQELRALYDELGIK